MTLDFKTCYRQTVQSEHLGTEHATLTDTCQKAYLLNFYILPLSQFYMRQLYICLLHFERRLSFTVQSQTGKYSTMLYQSQHMYQE